MSLPTPSTLPAPQPAVLPELPQSWSALTWRQLCDVWTVKMRYGGNPDVAQAAALLALCGLTPVVITESRHNGITGGSRRNNDITVSRYNDITGEAVYTLRGEDGRLWTVTPRELSQMAHQTLPWFPYPYGDPGKPAVKDDNGKVIEEAVNPVRGYVSPMRDAMILPQREVVIKGLFGRRTLDTAGTQKFSIFNVQCSMIKRHFALPQMACNNLTWQQYRSLQAVTPQLFQEGISDDDALDLQAQFLAHCLTPRSLALLDTSGGNVRIRPHYTYQYDSVRAEKMVPYWKKLLSYSVSRDIDISTYRNSGNAAQTLFHICFQCYQTALTYYAAAYPLLFSEGGKNDPMKDALQGEVGTINAVMMKANYTNQQEVYDSNLPFILDILNTMAKEAKEIEAMNAKIKHKK